MGLDMYLYARKRFDIGGDVGVAILGHLSSEQLTELNDTKSVYLSRWKFRGETPEGRAEIERAEAVNEAAGMLGFACEGSEGGDLRLTPTGDLEVSICAAYWRKANAVHAWFVDQCQGGVDECQESDPIHVERLAELRSRCAKALELYEAGDHRGAGEQMAPRPGFFFGGTDLDEGWAYDMRDTVEQVERVVHQAIEVGGVEFVYQSSW